MRKIKIGFKFVQILRESDLCPLFWFTYMAAVTPCENDRYQNHLISLKVVLVVSPNSSLPSAGELLCYLYFNTWIQLNCVAWRECAVNGAQWVNIPRFGRKWPWNRYRWIIWWACHIADCWEEQYFHVSIRETSVIHSVLNEKASILLIFISGTAGHF